MTYNEWRDELKSNLLCVSEAERRRVLDYYAEAYADRRDAGFSEREIIEDFGAPYDAAQRILNENSEEYYEQPKKRANKMHRDDGDCFEKDFEPKREKKRRAEREESYSPPPERHSGGSDNSWIFVLLCVIFAVPLFGLIMGMIGITVGVCAAPFGLLVAGVATIGAGVGTLFSDVAYGATLIGTGMIIFGVSLILMPLLFKLVGLMWKAFKAVFGWIKGLFSNKERA